MSIPVTQPLNFGLSEALDRLGLKSATFPNLAPVLVVADISQTVSSELVEARKQVAFDLIAVAGQFGFAEITARSRGGIVVESVLAVVDPTGGISFPVPTLRLQVLPTLGVGGPQAGLASDIGGLPAVSETRVGASAFPVITPAGGCTSLVCPNQISGTGAFWGQAPSRIYVPASGTLVIQTNEVNTPFQFVAVWRELADIQGIP